MDWDAAALRIKLTFGFPDRAELTLSESPAERQLALQAVKQRLYHATFREAVITAYKGRWALSGLLEPLLLRTVIGLVPAIGTIPDTRSIAVPIPLPVTIVV